MADDITKYQHAYIWARNVYVFAMLIYMLALICIPLQMSFHGALSSLYTAAPVLGLAITVYGLICKEIDFSFFGLKPLTAFLAVMAISCAVNYRYDLIDNVKEICWTIIPIALLYCPGRHESPSQKMRYLAETIFPVGIIFSVLCAISIGQFFYGYGETLQNPISSGTLRYGFVDGRLFGMFTDPNYASLSAALLSIGMIVAMRNMHNRAVSVVCILSVILQLLFVSLAESRGALICLAAASFFLGLVFLYKRVSFRWPKKRVRGVILPVFSGALCAVLMIGVVLGVHTVCQGVPALTQTTNTAAQSSNSAANTQKGSVKKTTPQERPDTAAGSDISNNRFTIWNDAVSIWKTTPIVGASPRGYLDYASDTLGDIYIVQRQYMLHSTYVSVLTFSGLLGVLALATWLGMVLYRFIKYCFRANPKTDDNYVSTVLLFAGILAVLVDALVLTSVFYSNYFPDYLFWLFMGTALTVVAKERKVSKGVQESADKAASPQEA